MQYVRVIPPYVLVYNNAKSENMHPSCAFKALFYICMG